VSGIDAYTVLLLHMDGADQSTSFPDSSTANPKTVTPAGSAKIVTAQQAPLTGNGASGLFGSGNYLSVAASTDFAFSGNFTIDFWIRFNSLPGSGAQAGILSRVLNASNNFYFSLWNNGGVLTWFFQNTIGGSDATDVRVAANSIATNTWYHIAIMRSTNSLYVFQDGALCGSAGSIMNAVPDMPSTPLMVGGMPYWSIYLDGWMDEVRIQNGEAAFSTSGFTRPSVEYSADGTTSTAAVTLPLPVASGGESSSVVMDAELTLPLPAAYGDLEGQGVVGDAEVTLPLPDASGTLLVPTVCAAALALPVFTVGDQLIVGTVSQGAGNISLAVAASAFRGETHDAELDLPLIEIDALLHGPYLHDTEMVLPLLVAQGFMGEVDKAAWFAMSMNTRHYGLSTYERFDFNSFCEFQGLYLGASDEGIFVLEGEHDNTVPINWDVIFPRADFGVPQLKRLPHIYAELACDSDVILSLIADETDELDLPPIPDSGMAVLTRKLSGPRGRKGRYMTLRLRNEGAADVFIDSIEILAAVVPRRV
jgi:hypothetical protein